jgi:sterol desaturase/sphingolipid hydroxylase (fatty acid hydroxylase superfamily)
VRIDEGQEAVVALDIDRPRIQTAAQQNPELPSETTEPYVSVPKKRARWTLVYTALLAIGFVGVLAAAFMQLSSVSHSIFQIVSGSKPIMLAYVAAILAMSAVLLIFERLFPAAPLASVRDQVLKLKIGVFYLLMVPVIGAITGALSGYLSQSVGLGLFKLELSSQYAVLQVIATFLVWRLASDFFYYWFHRFQHESFLWHQHKLHHLDERLSGLSSTRNHFLETLLYAPVYTIPVAILIEFSPVTGGLVGLSIGIIDLFWQVLVHANLRLGWGRLSWLLNSPQLHRIHHSRLLPHHDKNYAAMFPIWDVLFGTYYHPAPGEYPPTGVLGERDIGTLWDANLVPFRAWSRSLRQRAEHRRSQRG